MTPSFTFGDSRALCDRLIALVRSGRKTATCGALRDFTEGGEAMPVVGEQAIALDWDGQPALLIETISVEIVKFRDVPEDFALAGDESTSREGWARAHAAFFARTGGFSEDMALVCERFRLVRSF